MEALGQHVKQEAPDELVWVQGHRLPTFRAFDAIVLPVERHAAVVGCDQPPVRDGDAVCVARQIPQHLLGPRERRLAVDHPPGMPQRSEEPLEPLRIEEGRELSMECQAASRVCLAQHRYELAPEQCRQHVHMQQKVGPGGDPSRAIGRKPATWHDHVHVRMVRHR